MVSSYLLGTIQILRKQLGWVGEVGQMLTFAYKVSGWVKAKVFIVSILKFCYINGTKNFFKEIHLTT